MARRTPPARWKSEDRNPKTENRKKAETRKPKAEVTELDVLLASLNRGDFGFRTSDFIRPSVFGFRASRRPHFIIA